MFLTRIEKFILLGISKGMENPEEIRDKLMGVISEATEKDVVTSFKSLEARGYLHLTQSLGAELPTRIDLTSEGEKEVKRLIS